MDAETQDVLRQFIEENMRRGMPAEQFEKDKKELFEGARKAADEAGQGPADPREDRRGGEDQVTERDIDAFIYREAARTQQQPDKLAKELAKDRERAPLGPAVDHFRQGG